MIRKNGLAAMRRALDRAEEEFAAQGQWGQAARGALEFDAFEEAASIFSCRLVGRRAVAEGNERTAST